MHFLPQFRVERFEQKRDGFTQAEPVCPMDEKGSVRLESPYAN